MQFAQPINVLLVEDSPTDVLLAKESLAQVPNIRLTCVERLAEAVALLGGNQQDVVLLDLGLPDSQGLATLVKLLERAGQVPIVVMTGRDDEALGLQALGAVAPRGWR